MALKKSKKITIMTKLAAGSLVSMKQLPAAPGTDVTGKQVHVPKVKAVKPGPLETVSPSGEKLGPGTTTGKPRATAQREGLDIKEMVTPQSVQAQGVRAPATFSPLVGGGVSSEKKDAQENVFSAKWNLKQREAQFASPRWQGSATAKDSLAAARDRLNRAQGTLARLDKPAPVQAAAAPAKVDPMKTGFHTQTAKEEATGGGRGYAYGRRRLGLKPISSKPTRRAAPVQAVAAGGAPPAMQWEGSTYRQRLAFGKKHGKGKAYRQGLNKWYKDRIAKRKALKAQQLASK